MNDFHIYLTPYISFKENKAYKTIKTRNVFRSESGNIYKKKINFDPLDGTKVEPYEEKYEDIIKIQSWSDIFYSAPEQNFDIDELSTAYSALPGYVILLPNKRGDNFHNIGDDPGVLSIESMDDIEDIKKIFYFDYQKEIDFIKAEFEEVTINYGVVSYYY